MRADTSSSDCDESMVLPTPKAKSTPISIKREPVTTSESSSEENEPTASRTNPANHNASSDSGDSSSDEDERLNSTVKAVVKKERLSQQTSDSSEESDNEVETPFQQNPAQDSSSEDEASDTKPQVSMNHSRLAHTLSNSEESSDDELPMDRTVSNLKSVKNIERGDSHVEASKPRNPGRVQDESSSSEDESDESSNNQQKSTMNGASSSEESDEELNKHDDRPKTVSASNNTQNKHADSSTEDESEEESDDSDGKRKTIPNTSLKQSPQSSSDSSDESDREIPSSSRSKSGSSNKSSDVQVKMEIESILDRGEQSSSSSDSEDNKWPVNPIHQVRTSILRGSELMKAVFKEHVLVDPMDAQLGYEDITSEDEIWLIQCPRSLDATALKKQTIDLYGKTSFLTQEGQTFKRYYSVSEPDSSQNINCVLPSKKSKSFKMFNMAVEGKIVIEEHVHIPKLKPPAVHPKTSVPLPSGLKVRHPLLGIEYKEHIKAAQKSIKYNIKQKKKKKDKTTSASDGPSISGDINTSSGSGHRTLADLSTDCVDGIVQFQKKKKKHKSDQFEGLSSVNLSSPGKKRHNHNNSITNPNLLNVVVKTEPAIETDNNHVSDELTRKKHKKSKKENRVQDCGILELAKNTANGQSSPIDETPKNKKSKKAKHERVQDSPNIQGSLNSKYQGDFETPKMKKPKKLKYRDSLPLFASEIKQEIVSDETSKCIFNGSETTGRKRKKDRDSSDATDHSSKKKQKLNDSPSSLNISLGKKEISR